MLFPNISRPGHLNFGLFKTTGPVVLTQVGSPCCSKTHDVKNLPSVRYSSGLTCGVWQHRPSATSVRLNKQPLKPSCCSVFGSFSRRVKLAHNSFYMIQTSYIQQIDFLSFVFSSCSSVVTSTALIHPAAAANCGAPPPLAR